MPDTPVRMLCLAGSGRSGSTLLALLLGQQSGIVSVGEFYRFWALGEGRLCGCGQATAVCPFWEKARKAAAIAVPAFDPARAARFERKLFHNRGTNMFALRRRI